MKMLKRSLVLAIVLCLATVFFTSTVYAFAEKSCCVVECFCMNCRCGDDCFCEQECDYINLLCYVCKALIVERREVLGAQQIVVATYIIYVYPPLTRVNINADVSWSYTASIIEDKVRMNN